MSAASSHSPLPKQALPRALCSSAATDWGRTRLHGASRSVTVVVVVLHDLNHTRPGVEATANVGRTRTVCRAGSLCLHTRKSRHFSQLFPHLRPQGIALDPGKEVGCDILTCESISVASWATTPPTELRISSGDLR